MENVVLVRQYDGIQAVAGHALPNPIDARISHGAVAPPIRPQCIKSSLSGFF